MPGIERDQSESLLKGRVKVPEGVEVIPEDVERKDGPVQVVNSQPDAQVFDEMGRPLIETQENRNVVIQIPTTEERLTELSKGKPEDASTWWSISWIRTIQKAIHFGWMRVFGVKEKQPL